MKLLQRTIATSTLCLAAAMTATVTIGITSAQAQTYPDKLIRLIVANSPGSTPDNLARVFAPIWSKVIGQPVVVDYKAGAGGTVGTEYIAKSVAPDGYNVLFCTVPDHATYRVFVKDLRFDPVKDLTPVLALAEAALMLASPIDTPWNSFGEMVAYAKANPGKLNIGNPGAQSFSALQWQAIAQQMGLNVVTIAYTGGGPFVTAIVSGQVQLGWMNVLTSTGPGKGKVKVLAVTGTKRDPVYPDVPTLAELGMPRLVGSMYALMVPSATPRNVVDKINSSANTTIQQPEVRDPLAKNGFTTLGGTGDALARRMADLEQYYTDIANKLGIKPQ